MVVSYKGKNWVNLWWKGLLVILLCLIASGWFRKVLLENYLVTSLFFVNTITLIFYYFGGSKTLTKLFVASFLLLIFFQFRTTKITNTYSFTPSELDLQITRMNSYPPSLARLGYILERKKEVRIIDRTLENFIETVDFNQYFPNYFSFLTLPFFLIGLYWFLRSDVIVSSMNKSMTIKLCLLTAILTLTLLGVRGNYGPFLVFPYIILFIFIGIYKLVRKIKHYE